MNQIATRPETSINSIGIATGAGGSSIAPQNLGEVVRFAEVMCKADIALPKHLRGNAGACMAVAMQAMEWQMSPFAVASKSYAVNGAIAYEAQLIAAVVNSRSGIQGRLKYYFEGDGAAMTCRVVGILDGEECEYISPAIGSITTKNSPLWKSDPQQQLGYFSARSWARRHCPEVILGVYDREEVEQFRGSESARDVTPSLAERLNMARIEQHEPTGPREGFDPDFVTREAESLSSATETDTDQHSSSAPSADEEGSGDASPHAATPAIPSEPNSDDETGEPAQEAPEGPDAAGSPVDPEWIKTFAKVVVASIGPDEADVVTVSKSLFKEGLSDDQRGKARSITNYARAVSRSEMERADALDVIAGVAGMDAKEFRI